MPAIKKSKSEGAALLSTLLTCCFIACAGLGVQSVANVKLADQKQSEAQRAMDRADTLRANWTKASLQDAINEYEKAALIWTFLSDFASASQATLKSGDIYFVFNEYGEALKRYQKAEALARKADDWLLKASALSRMGRLQSFIGNNELAQQQLTRALDLFKQHEARRNDIAANAYAEALSNLAEVSYAKGDFVKAREQLKSAIEVVHGDPKVEAKIHLFKGYITGSLGDTDKAVTEISRAKELYQQANDRIGEWLAHTTLALAPSLKRDVNRATDLHRQAIDIFRAIGDRHSEAIALTASGQVYEGVHHYQLAIYHYEQALRLYEEIGSVDGMSVTTFRLAATNNLSGRADLALEYYERGVQLSRSAGKVRTEANALTEIAKVYASHGRHELALQQYQKIQRFYEAIGDLQGKAMALNGYAEVLLQLGQNEQALDVCLRALPLSEKAGDKGILISTLYNLARANLGVGSLDLALSFIGRSLGIIEDLRANVASPDFRVSYLSGVRKHHELCIDILMQLDRLHPERGFAAEALLVSEKGRARLLLDLIWESAANLRQGAGQTLLARERELRKLFALHAEYRMNLLLSRKDTAEVATVDDQLTQIRVKYQQVQAELRQQNPRLFSIEQSTPLSLQQIQNELRDSDTMLLEFSLGDERSYLWAITSNSHQSYDLPARKIIEDASRELYKLITARQRSAGQTGNDYQSNVEAADKAYLEKATNLSQMLLGPVAEQLGNKRLLVVTDGVLQHIPLEALPVSIASEERSTTFLIDRNEVIVLPSISALVAIRTARNRPSSPSKLVAVIADPVFSASDERVPSEGVARGAAPPASDKRSIPDLPQIGASGKPDGELPRLAHASEEADAISAVAPWGTTLVAKGFEANRETAMSSEVGQYQILHFATHGFLESERPELSGIVLSSVDRDGNETDGLMALHDIYSLDLSAELTVLSACQTALGKDVKGEGLIGLTHSFMSAGSNTVVASLWKVDDRATAVLMTNFYESMLQKGMSPAAALRAAKLKLMQDKRWSAPYYWAGFVLQGEYTNRIAVARYSWLLTGLLLLSFLILVAAALLITKKRQRRPSAVQST